MGTPNQHHDAQERPYCVIGKDASSYAGRTWMTDAQCAVNHAKNLLGSARVDEFYVVKVVKIVQRVAPVEVIDVR